MCLRLRPVWVTALEGFEPVCVDFEPVCWQHFQPTGRAVRRHPHRRATFHWRCWRGAACAGGGPNALRQLLNPDSMKRSCAHSPRLDESAEAAMGAASIQCAWLPTRSAITTPSLTSP